VARHLEDLDELVLKCRNKNAREYIREAVASYRAEAYRSAIVSCWVAVCYDLIEKLRELSLAGDSQAQEKIQELDRIYQSNDISKSLQFERGILDFAKDRVELISALEHEDLKRILKDRHRCAHPTLNAEGEQYAPPAELARLHIHSAVTHLLQHEPAQGKFALERILKQIRSDYFPTRPREVLNAFQNSPIRRARRSLVNNLISVIIKDLLLEDLKDYTTASKLTSSLHALHTLHRNIYETRCSEILSRIIGRVDDEKLYHVVDNISRFPYAWESLDYTQRERLKAYVLALPTADFSLVDDVLSFSPLRDEAVKRVKRASIDDLETVFVFVMPKEVIDRCIELYHESRRFDEANRVAKIIKTFALDFSKEQIQTLLSRLAANDQIKGSFEFPKVLEKIRAVASNRSVSFDELLRDSGLEEYCEDTSEGRNEIPF